MSLDINYLQHLQQFVLSFLQHLHVTIRKFKSYSVTANTTNDIFIIFLLDSLYTHYIHKQLSLSTDFYFQKRSKYKEKSTLFSIN